MEIILARPRGFCAGVIRAIKIVENALCHNDIPVYVLHEIVHNRHVVENLKKKGAHFAENLEDIPDGALTIFSAHGVSKVVEEQANKRKLKVIDATCPLVNKVHLQAQRFSSEGRELIIIGHHGHPEVEGTRGRADGIVHILSTTAEVNFLDVRDPDRLAYVTQTTLSISDTSHIIDSLRQRFPTIKGPKSNDICYATQSRQNAVRILTQKIDVLLVVGSRNSSNSNRLRETGEQGRLPAYLIEDAEEVDPNWVQGKNRIGLTAGASAPEILVEGVLQKLRTFGIYSVSEMTDVVPEDSLLF
jgi:4-hydroxy-3-methylbut-2-enyl diphosphate reductase